MRNKYTKELIEKALIDANSWADVCRRVGIKPATGAQSHLSKVARKFGLNPKLKGKAHNKGKKSARRRSAIDYLFGVGHKQSHTIKLVLIRDGLKKKECENCGLVAWLGDDLPFELDHINCDHSDWRLENLQILCPNCHAVKTRRDRQARVAKRKRQTI